MSEHKVNQLSGASWELKGYHGEVDLLFNVA